MYDLPFDQSYLIENVIDPAHVHISHDGTPNGGKRENAQPLEMEVIESSAKGIRGMVRETRRPNQPWKPLNFVAPNLIFYEYGIEQRGWFGGLVFYSLPLGKNRCRVLARNYRNFLTRKVKLIPRWFDHWNRNQLFEEDLQLVLGQQAQIEQLGQHLKELFLPLKTSDVLVIEYRKWLDKYGQSLPFYEGYSTSKRAGNQAEYHQTPVPLDRFSGHTQICSSCNRAYQVTNRLKQGSLMVAIAIAALAIVIDEPVSLKLVTVFAFLAALAMSAVAQTVKTKFERSYERR